MLAHEQLCRPDRGGDEAPHQRNVDCKITLISAKGRTRPPATRAWRMSAETEARRIAEELGARNIHPDQP